MGAGDGTRRCIGRGGMRRAAAAVRYRARESGSRRAQGGGGGGGYRPAMLRGERGVSPIVASEGHVPRARDLNRT